MTSSLNLFLTIFPLEELLLHPYLHGNMLNIEFITEYHIVLFFSVIYLFLAIEWEFIKVRVYTFLIFNYYYLEKYHY